MTLLQEAQLIATSLEQGSSQSQVGEQLIRFRMVSPDDAELISRSIQTASSETLHHRFFAPVRHVPIPKLRELLDIDHESDCCFLGEIETTQGWMAICGARYVRIDDPVTAEIALTVHDDFQRRGLGRRLLLVLAHLARHAGIECFEAFVLPSNSGMLGLTRSLAPGHIRSSIGETIKLLISLNEILSVNNERA